MKLRWFRKRIKKDEWHNCLSNPFLQYYDKDKKKWLEVLMVEEKKTKKGEKLNIAKERKARRVRQKEEDAERRADISRGINPDYTRHEDGMM